MAPNAFSASKGGTPPSFIESGKIKNPGTTRGSKKPYGAFACGSVTTEPRRRRRQASGKRCLWHRPEPGHRTWPNADRMGGEGLECPVCEELKM